MNWSLLFNRDNSAPVACERLQILLAHERSALGRSNLISDLKEEILAAISRHGGAERNLLARLDLDRFAGRGIASHASGTLAHLEDAEAGDADTFALLQMLRHQADRIVEYLFRLLFCQFMLLGDSCGEMLERHGRLGCLGRWGPSFCVSTR